MFCDGRDTSIIYCDDMYYDNMYYDPMVLWNADCIMKLCYAIMIIGLYAVVILW